MRSLTELKEVLVAAMNQYSREQEAKELIAMDALHQTNMDMTKMYKVLAGRIETMQALNLALSELARHNSDEAVEVIRGEVLIYRYSEPRALALRTLSTMTAPTARKVVAKSASRFSFKSKEEKQLARSLLEEMPPS